jgi:glycosyltransferase involved in cell wall biosynthesis
MRVGGLDIVLNGLEHQIFTDFELIIADGIYQYRKDEVRKRCESYAFPVKHVEPIHNPFPITSFCRYSNTALVHASGEIVLFITDYTWLPPDCLWTHAEFHISNSSKDGLMCPHQYTTLPSLNPKFPTYLKPEIDKYVYDIDSGQLDECKWTIFEKEFEGKTEERQLLKLDPIMGNADQKLFRVSGGIGSEYFHAKNESCRLEAVLDINGWDENLDGTNCYQDSDLADRLTVKAGIQWMCNPVHIAYILNPRHIFPWPQRLRPIESNHVIWQSKKNMGYPPVNKWNIRETREQMKNL